MVTEIDRWNQALLKIVKFRDEGKPLEDLNSSLIKTVVDILPGLYKKPKLIDIAGEAVIISAIYRNKDEDTKVALKILLPVRVESKWDKYRPKKREKFEHINEMKLRFIRGISIQRQLYDIIKSEQLENICCVPKVIRQFQSPTLGFAMEYMESQKLLDWCENTTGEKEICDMFEKILIGVMHCFHGCKLVHTDFKPQNFIISSNRVCFLDFGIAKIKGDEQKIITSVKTKELNSGIFSTERQRAFPRLRGYYEDIYSLGIIFHCMFCRGLPPIIGDPKHLWDVFSPDVLPQGFREFFVKCTDERSDEKYQDITYMYNDFRSICNEYFRNMKTTVIDNTKSVNVFGISFDMRCLEYVKEENRGVVYNLLKGIECLQKKQDT